MNEHNHHRIIQKFVSDNHLSQDIFNVFKEASDFTDAISEENFFFQHFYYDIKISNDTIILSRSDEKNDNSKSSMRHCENIGNIERKHFFSLINDRPRPLCNTFEKSNQSDNVAFLHAMGSESETEDQSKALFKEHLKKCFAECLFLKDEKKARFMLGIAMHGIMDSFTPSHMKFQHYMQQSMALHAQGDVIPILDSKEKVEFVPGQCNHDGILPKYFGMAIKGFDDGEDVNNVEYVMLEIFLHISNLTPRQNGESIPEQKTTETFLKDFKGKTRSSINKILEQYKYGDEAYVFSTKALEAMKNVWFYLAKYRKYKYEDYKKEKNRILNEALNKWEEVYNSMKKQREAHVRLNLYTKLPNNVTAHIANEIQCAPQNVGKIVNGELSVGDEIETVKKEIVNPYIEKGAEIVNPYIEKGAEIVNPYIEQAGEALNQVAEQATPYIEQAGEKLNQIGEALNQVAEQATPYIEQAGESLNQIGESLNQVVEQVAEQATPYIEQAGESLNQIGDFWNKLFK